MRNDTITLLKRLKLDRNLQQSMAYEGPESWDAGRPLAEQNVGEVEVLSCTPLKQPSSSVHLAVLTGGKALVFVDGVQRILFRKVLDDLTRVYLVAMAAAAVEVWPRGRLLTNTLRRELVLYVPSHLGEAPSEDAYNGMDFKVRTYDAQSAGETLGGLVSNDRDALEFQAMKAMSTSLDSVGMLFKDGPLKMFYPSDLWPWPVGLVKSLEPIPNAELFLEHVKQLKVGRVSSLLEVKSGDGGFKKFVAYLRLLDVGSESSMEGLVRLDFVGADLPTVSTVAEKAVEAVVNLARVGPYSRSPYNVLAVDWLEKRLRELLPDANLVALDLARRVRSLG